MISYRSARRVFIENVLSSKAMLTRNYHLELEVTYVLKSTAGIPIYLAYADKLFFSVVPKQ